LVSSFGPFLFSVEVLAHVSESAAAVVLAQAQQAGGVGEGYGIAVGVGVAVGLLRVDGIEDRVGGGEPSDGGVVFAGAEVGQAGGVGGAVDEAFAAGPDGTAINIWVIYPVIGRY
jgi:hypothetical protein